jgi:hypothetical protein
MCRHIGDTLDLVRADVSGTSGVKKTPWLGFYDPNLRNPKSI